ncbi:cytochrome P450 [Sphingomonas sp. MMS24-JH45]
MASRAPQSVPTPPGLPVVGHLHQIARAGLIGHLLKVSREMPEGIFKLRFGSRVSLFVTDPDLVAELSDETRFRKMPGPGLRVVRKFAGDGLFTAFSEEPNWGKAHRILLPAFSQRAMRGYFDMIVEVCDQLVAKWTRAAGTDVADDMTRLTLDSIAIAGFGHRSIRSRRRNSTASSSRSAARCRRRSARSRACRSSRSSRRRRSRNTRPTSPR